MASAWLVLPNALVEAPPRGALACDAAFVVEEPMFFHDAERRPYRHHRG